MSKHRLSPVPLPAAKRRQTRIDQTVVSTPLLNFDSSLYDELILVIFSYLSWTDLCTIQPTNRLWSRLASDNQLWKDLFIHEYGRLRLRGSRGFVSRHDDRKVKPLPHAQRSYAEDHDTGYVDWKWMFRISLNWRRGRCKLERFTDPVELAPRPDVALGASIHSCALLAGSLAITTSSQEYAPPHINLHKRGAAPYILKGKLREQTSTYVTALALDQSPPLCGDHKLRVVAFYDTGEFSIFRVDHSQPQHSRLLLTYHPRSRTDRTAPIRQAAYHHRLLVTLSHSFKLSLYDLSDGIVVHTQTLHSFSSYPPTSMVLTLSPKSYRLVLAYSAPVYPSDWSAAVTVLTISPADSESRKDTEDEDCPKPFTVATTRTVRAFDVPSGWIDDSALRAIREQWGRRAARVADIQTDGKWVVLAPADRLPFMTSSACSSSPSPSSSSTSTSSPAMTRLGSTACALQLYRLHIPAYSSSSSTNGLKLTFVRYLYGHIGPVVALALADGRCVSRGADGSLWVWDLERAWGVEVETTQHDPIHYSADHSAPESSTTPGSSTILDSGGVSSDSEDDHKVRSSVSANVDWDEEVPIGTPLASVVFDERRIVTTDSYGVEMRRFDI